MLSKQTEPASRSISREPNNPRVQLHKAGLGKTGAIENVPLIEPHAAVKFRYRILVVDDEQSIRETAKPLLESQGYEVLTAADGLDGLLALSQSLPDVIISDLHMPRMSGFELLTIVRQRFPRIGIIAMSGEYIPGANLQVIMADAFWQKGQSIKKLFQEVASVVAASPARLEREKHDVSPLLVQRGDDGNLIITCPRCLRPSKLEAIGLNGGIHETTCRSCGEPVKFEIDHKIEVFAH